MMISSNPDDANDTVGTNTFVKLNSLCTSIESCIRDHSKRSGVDKELLAIRQASFKEQAPEAEYATRLFKRLIDETFPESSLKENNKSVLKLIAIPPAVYEGTGEQLVGKSAMSKNIFWLRVINTALSIGSFVIMSLVPRIMNNIVEPDDIFSNSCPYRNHISGSFDYTGFQFALCITVLLCMYSILVLIYYILPTNEDSHKYIPGLGSILRHVMSPEKVEHYGHSLGRMCRRESKVAEASLDTLLWLLTIIAGIMAAVTLEQARPFSLHSLSLDNTNTGDISPYYYAGQLEGQDETLPPPVLYLSPASFYATFERTSPSCLNDGAVELIRASVALLFLTVISGVLTIQISISSYRKERQLKLKAQAARRLPTDTHPPLSLSLSTYLPTYLPIHISN
mmetsp:Transcript_13030/g.13089  ORF Transcript_13030/g.13089 Transcript_13030/m.13089 type:complete len:397 (-) Transcript_13030:30-1220(-)